jgi:hypothetical protein
MALVSGWGCFEMKCFLTVLKSIGMMFFGVVVVAVFVGVISAATALTVYLFGIDPKSAWPLLVFVTYGLVGLGMAVGITECHG